MSKSLDKEGLEHVMKLLIQYTGSKTEELKTIYDNKFDNIVTAVNEANMKANSIEQTVNNAISSINESLESIVSAVQESTTTMIGAMQEINNKVDNLAESFDNLDSEVNSISKRLDDLSSSVDTRFSNLNDTISNEETGIISSIENIKEAMKKMIVNIETDPDTGKYIVYHYDGTVTDNTIVNSIDNDTIDDIINGEYSEDELENSEESAK